MTEKRLRELEAALARMQALLVELRENQKAMGFPTPLKFPLTIPPTP